MLGGSHIAQKTTREGRGQLQRAGRVEARYPGKLHRHAANAFPVRFRERRRHDPTFSTTAAEDLAARGTQSDTLADNPAQGVSLHGDLGRARFNVGGHAELDDETSPVRSQGPEAGLLTAEGEPERLEPGAELIGDAVEAGKPLTHSALSSAG